VPKGPEINFNAIHDRGRLIVDHIPEGIH